MSQCNELRDRYQEHLKLIKKYRALIKNKTSHRSFYLNKTSLNSKRAKVLTSIAYLTSLTTTPSE